MRPRSLFHLRSLTAAVLTVLTVAVPAGAAAPGAANTQAIVDLALRELSARKVAVPERAWLNLARLLLQRDRLREAEQALSNLRDLPPGPVQAERDYLLSLVLLERKRYAEAKAVD